MRHSRAFTLIELLVVISIIALLIGILLPALGRARRVANQNTSNTQIRGIHQSMVIFSQGNEGYYPGIERNGDEDLSVTTPWEMFTFMKERDFFTDIYDNSPAELNGAVAEQGGFYSYAVLDNDQDVAPGSATPRRESWRDNINGATPIVSDRAINNAAGALTGLGDPVRSLWTKAPPGTEQWVGGVVWNDNHITLEKSTNLSETQLTSSPAVTDDNLFDTADTADPDDNVIMIYAGTDHANGSPSLGMAPYDDGTIGGTVSVGFWATLSDP